MEENRAERPEESALCYGKNAVTELLKSGAGVDTVFLQETMNDAQASYYVALARQAGAVVKRVHPNKLRSMCGTDAHQGVAAFGAAVEYVTLEALLDAAAAKGEPPFLLLCDGIEDPHNLGAVVRSAEAAGAAAVVFSKRRSALPGGTVVKVSAG